ncbi:MAG: hypothetical protein ACI8R9_001348 [Paraglaciecola sp.]|jgi:hypothetical protein
MSNTSACKVVSYQCAHCKTISHGKPAETVVIEDQELTMCCLGCVYAAEMFFDLYHTGLYPKKS